MGPATGKRQAVAGVGSAICPQHCRQPPVLDTVTHTRREVGSFGMTTTIGDNSLLVVSAPWSDAMLLATPTASHMVGWTRTFTVMSRNPTTGAYR